MFPSVEELTNAEFVKEDRRSKLPQTQFGQNVLNTVKRLISHEHFEKIAFVSYDDPSLFYIFYSYNDCSILYSFLCRYCVLVLQ